MGCWNETCFISRLPIRGGEEVVLFFTAIIGRSLRDRTSIVYPADIEEPISLPINALYNDYGSVEHWDDNDVAVKISESLFNKPMDGILSAILNNTSDAVSIHNDNNKSFEASMLMAKKNVFDKITAQFKPHVKTKSFDLHERFNIKESIEKISRKGNITDVEAEILGSLKLSLKLKMIDSVQAGNIKISDINLEKELNKLWENTEVDERELLVQKYCKLAHQLNALNVAMTRLRLSWTPGSGAGAQSLNIKEHLQFCNIVKEAAIETYDDAEEMYSDMLDEE